MLIIALVLAIIGLAALVFAVVTSNELVAWVCIGASVLGVVLLIIDALQERRRQEAGADGHEPVTGPASEPVSNPVSEPPRPATATTDTVETESSESFYLDYPEEASADEPPGSEANAETPSASAETGTVTDEEAGTSSADFNRGETLSDDHNTRP